MDNRVLRFNHCGKIIYTFDSFNKLHNADLQTKGPRGCPVCFESVRFGLLDAPVAVPCPFSNGHKVPCAFLMASQLGPTYISERTDSELHVGITNSAGVVYSYTESGIQRQQQGWEQCLCVPLVAPVNNSLTLVAYDDDNNSSPLVAHGNHSLGFRKCWDRQLETFSCPNTWTPHRFAEERGFGSCCYGFALGFINYLRRAEGRECVSRDRFTSQHVLPRMKTASKYLSVYQHISLHGHYSVDI